MFAIVIYRDGLIKNPRMISIKNNMDTFLFSLFDRFCRPLGHGTAAGGLDVLDHQPFIARIGKDKIVTDFRVESNRAEIVQGFVELDLCIVLGGVIIGFTRGC